ALTTADRCRPRLDIDLARHVDLEADAAECGGRQAVRHGYGRDPIAGAAGVKLKAYSSRFRDARAVLTRPGRPEHQRDPRSGARHLRDPVAPGPLARPAHHDQVAAPERERHGLRYDAC